MKALTAVQVGAGWFSENPGGIDRYYHDLLDALPEAGVRCRGLVVGTDVVDQESDGSVRAFALPDEPLLRRWKAVRQAVGRLWQMASPDGRRVLVTHFALYAYPLLRDRSGRAWVMHFHGPWAGESSDPSKSVLNRFLKRRLEKAVYKKADRVITLSEAFRDVLVKQYGVDATKVDVIPGGVDSDRFAPAFNTPRDEARRQFGWAVDQPIVLTVRRLVPGMGLETLVDAMVIVRQRVPNALCLVAGRGPLAGPLNAQIEKAGLTDAVTLLGFVADEDLPLAYRGADVSVMPSQKIEGFGGVAAAESLAAGTPVLVTPTGGLPEIVRGLDPKLVMAGTTAEAMARSIVAALTDPAALPTPDACRTFTASSYDWRVIAQRIADVYAKTAAAKSP